MPPKENYYAKIPIIAAAIKNKSRNQKNAPKATAESRE